MKEKLDFTSPSQKLVAGGLIGLTLLILYYITPPLVELFKNLWLLALYVVPLLIAVLNYQTIWVVYKQLVWKTTQKLISTDKLAYMYQYHDYLVEKIKKLEDNTKNITTAKVKLERKLAETLNIVKENTERAKLLENRKDSEMALKNTYNKVNVDTKIAQSLAPKLDSITTQEKYLVDLIQHWTSDAEQLKYTLDAKAEEYKILKETSEATGNASAFLKGNTVEYKMFEESLKQIEQDISLYTANVETFEKKVAPILEGKVADREFSEEQGKQLVAEFMEKTKEIGYISNNR